MPSDLERDMSPAEAEAGLPEPPPPEGPGLFGFDDAPAPAAAPPPEAGKPGPPEAGKPGPPEAGKPGPPEAAKAAQPVVPRPTAPYRVLARKYRPQALDDLIGQEALVRTLRNAFARGRVHHAFLMTGVRGVGKTTTARIIARALNCVGVDGKGGPTADPCGVCPECTAILADRHPDVIEMDAASNRGIDDVRELREALRFRPAQGRQKVFILDEVHMLTEQAFNALLKSLEEPPPAITFILATTELRKVPVTIRSRCQTFALKRVPEERLRTHFARIAGLEGAEAEPDALALLARAADGSVRDGLSLLDQAIALAGEGGRVSAESVRDMLGLADRGLVLDMLEAVLRGDLPPALARLSEAHDRGADAGNILSDMLEQVHIVTRFAAIPALRDDQGLPENERVRGAALAASLSVPALTRAWQMLLKGLEEVQHAPDRRAAAEMVLIRLAHVADMPTPGDILKRLEAGGGGGWARARAFPLGRGAARHLGRRRGAGRARPRRAARPAPARLLARGGGAGERRRAPAPRPSAARRPSGAGRARADRDPRPAAGPARPGRAADAAAGGADRRALDHRAVQRAGRADAGRAIRRRRTGPARRRRHASAGGGDPLRLSGRDHGGGAGCQSRRLRACAGRANG